MYQTIRFLHFNGNMEAVSPRRVAFHDVAMYYANNAMRLGDAVIIRGPAASGKTQLLRAVANHRQAVGEYHDTVLDTSAFWHGYGYSKQQQHEWVSAEPGNHASFNYDASRIHDMVREMRMAARRASRKPMLIAGGFVRLPQLHDMMKLVWEKSPARAVLVIDCLEDYPCDYMPAEVRAKNWGQFEWLDPNYRATLPG